MDKETIDMLNKQLRLIDFRIIELPFIEIDCYNRPRWDASANDDCSLDVDTFRFCSFEVRKQIKTERDIAILDWVIKRTNSPYGNVFDFPFIITFPPNPYKTLGEKLVKCFNIWAMDFTCAKWVLNKLNSDLKQFQSTEL